MYHPINWRKLINIIQLNWGCADCSCLEIRLTSIIVKPLFYYIVHVRDFSLTDGIEKINLMAGVRGAEEV